MKIPYGKQYIDNGDIQEVIDVLKSDYLTTGPKVFEFEKAFAKKVGAKYAVSCANGTAALHIACLSSSLTTRDELITSPMTFSASSNCALYCNAKPIFVDIKVNGNIDETKIENKITHKTKILIPVHYSGRPCNMESIKNTAKKNNLIVIEDASHALGATYKGHSVGDCHYSDMATFSFHPVKHITTGEGGIVVTNSKELYEKLKVLRNHGITKETEKMTKCDGPWYYEMQSLGYNYRLTDIQCALGLSQLKKLDSFVRRRKEIAQIYYDAFEDYPYFDVINDEKGIQSSYHLFPILLKEPLITKRKEIFELLRKCGLWVQVHYIPVYNQPYYNHLGYTHGICPEAEQFYLREISIPMYPGMSNDDVKIVIDTIKNIFKKYE